MDEKQRRALLEDEENRNEFAIRREERQMAAEERELEREMASLEVDEEHVKQEIEAELRREHMGLDPERRLGWLNNKRDDH
jgi:hypothetical protein